MRFRRLSRQSSAEPGQFTTARVPWQREPMDVFNDPDVEEIVCMWPTQVGKTECMILNPLGYTIHQDPVPTMALMPTVEMAQALSKDRVSPMVRDTPVLHELVQEPRAKDSSNTILHKTFPGGHMTFAGANSPASLASRPICRLLCDEVDKYPASAGSEGDPIALAKERTSTFWNRKILLTGTPTIKGFSRIEGFYENSDRRKYYVPCPKCGGYQVLMWSATRENPGMLVFKTPDGKEYLPPDEVHYQCGLCNAKIYESDKARMLTLGEWRAEAPFEGRAGFWLNRLYSPWTTWAQMVKNFKEAKRLPETLRVFVNTQLAETFEEKGDTVSDHNLIARREHYGPQVPEGVLVVTAGVDIQEDRVEVSFWGYGFEMEKWLLDHIVIPGDFLTRAVQTELDHQLERTFTTTTDHVLHVTSTFIDSGHKTQAVYDYTKVRQARRIYACKGISQAAHPVFKRPQRKNKKGVSVIMVGVDQAKEILYSHLKLAEPGPGYCHFPFYGVASKTELGMEYFKGLTAEKIITRYHKGFAKREWVLEYKRNEPLDCAVYSLAAFYNLNANLDAVARQRGETPPARPAQPGMATQTRRRGRRVISKGVE